jgi:hypothetical protein
MENCFTLGTRYWYGITDSHVSACQFYSFCSLNNAAAGRKSADVGDYDYEDSGESSSCGGDYDYEDLTDEKYVKTGLKETSSTGEDWIISNVSPIDLGHSLLLPSVNLCQPQVKTSTLVSIEIPFFCLICKINGSSLPYPLLYFSASRKI